MKKAGTAEVRIKIEMGPTHLDDQFYAGEFASDIATHLNRQLRDGQPPTVGGYGIPPAATVAIGVSPAVFGELPLRLSLTEHMRLRIDCTATPEQNNGEQCLWVWYPDSGDDGENGVTLHNAVKHCQERHGAPSV